MTTRGRSAACVLLLVAAGCGGDAAREAAEAWPAVEGFLAAFEQRRFDDDALAVVHEGFSSVMGVRRPGAADLERADVERRADGSLALSAVWPATYERGEAVVETRATRSSAGAWSVDACSVRSAAFTWVLR